MQFYRIPWKWQPMPLELSQAQAALARVLLEWEHTPYLMGSAVKGQGVDCIRFVCAVYFELEGKEFDGNLIQLLPPDSAMHDRAGAMGVIKTLKRLFEPVSVVDPPYLQPGDILAVGPSNGGPGHAMIVSPWKNVLFHAGSMEVCRTGMHLASHYQRIFKVFRKDNRECWR